MILVLTLKDLKRRLADPAALLLNLAIPLVMAGMMALAFGGGQGKDQDKAPVLRVLVLDEDDGPISRLIGGASQNPEAAKQLDLHSVTSREEGLRRLKDEEFAALLVIPQGFGRDLLDGRRVDLELVKNPSQSIMPVVAEQGAQIVALYLSIGARFVGDQAPAVRTLLDGKGWENAVAIAGLATSLYSRLSAADDLLFPPLIETGTEKKGESAPAFDFMGWMFPGMMMMGLLFTGLTQMKDLLSERDDGTLKRQLAGPLGAGQILVAKVLAVALVVAVAMAMLLLIGSLAFRVHWGAPGPLAVTSLAIVLAATGFAALVFALVRTARQGDALGGIMTMVMSLLGGAFLPPQILPRGLQAASIFTVSYWGHESLRTLTSGGGWDALAGQLAVLSILGVTTTGLGVALLARRHLKGTL